jgi:hypothetical protein
MKLRRLHPLCALLAALAVAGAAGADYPIEVIELRAALLEDILPVVRPLVGTNGTVTGMGNNLVIKAPPETVRQVRELLAEIDRPPRRLLITVSNAGDDSLHSSGYSASADVKIGDARVGINSPGRRAGDSRARIDLHDRDARRQRETGQQIQALEGRPAWIQAGTRVPVYGGYPPTTVLRNDVSGFYVVPRVRGERVMLEIYQRDDRPGTSHGAGDIQRAATTVSGNLGEWILLGGINDAGATRHEGTASALNRETASTRQIRVRVECPGCGAE